MFGRSQRPCGLRRGSAAALPCWDCGEWISVCCECCVLSGRVLSDELITRPEESYRPWCVVVCDLDTSWIRMSWSALGRRAKVKVKVKQEALRGVPPFQIFRQNFCMHLSDIRCTVTFPARLIPLNFITVPITIGEQENFCSLSAWNFLLPPATPV
jgi:hypothetical protein